MGSALWLSALTGGLAGSIITLFGQGFLRWWTRPILAIVFDNEAPGCRFRTPSVGGKTNYSFLRLKIENRGATMAEGTGVSVSHISFCAAGAGKRSFEEEVFDLGLALSGRAIFELASNTHRFVELVHVDLIDGKQHPKIYFSFLISAVRLRELGFDKGDYEMTVVATAKNAKSVKRTVKWAWDGTLEGLKVA